MDDQSATNAHKLYRKASREQHKRLKPGECLKYVRMVLDENILNTSYGQKLITALNEQELPYVVRKLDVSHCIIWERNAGQRLLNPAAATKSDALLDEWETEKLIVRLFTQKDIQEEIQNDTLSSLCQNIYLKFPQKNLTLIIVTNEHIAQKDIIARKCIEMQIMHAVCWQYHTLENLVAQLQRINKAVAESPYKQQRGEPLGGFKNYLANDKKQCVRVVGREGLSRLWQQNLNRLPGVTLHVCSAITSKYTCPKQLLDAYANDVNAANLLAEIRVLRGNGTTENARRLGDVISSKFYKFYASTNPDEVI